VSFGCQLNQGQIKGIKQLDDDLSKHRQMDVLIGVDMDQKGEEYSTVLSGAFTNAQKLTLDTKDQNEALFINRSVRSAENAKESI
jgi:5S rRNA maturation endonuclease (ribonuclease M5)